MRLLIQRVLSSSLSIDGKLFSQINKGMLLLVGIEEADTTEDIEWLVTKLLKLRIFNDQNGVMNLDINQIQGEIMAVSQFTLHASTQKGSRPSYIKAAQEPISRPLYEKFVTTLTQQFSGKVATGSFGADMQITLTNDGPVTLWLDTKNKKY